MRERKEGEVLVYTTYCTLVIEGDIVLVPTFCLYNLQPIIRLYKTLFVYGYLQSLVFGTKAIRERKERGVLVYTLYCTFVIEVDIALAPTLCHYNPQRNIHLYKKLFIYDYLQSLVFGTKAIRERKERGVLVHT